MNQIERFPLNSDLLRSFLVIAETGNLTSAAGQLSRTQSAISVQLRNLEESLGTTLFERSVKGMTLTNAGERLLPKAEAAVTQLQSISRLFEDPLVGRLKIGIPDDYESHILAHSLARFAKLNPGVDVTVVSGCTSVYPQSIRDGHLDMAVCSGPEPLGNMPISKEKAVWAASCNMRLDASEPVPLAVLDRSCWWKTIPTNALKDAGQDFRVSFRTESFGSLLAALNAGLAVSVLPQSCVTEDLQVLGTRTGLPRLSDIHRSIIFSDKAPTSIVQAMAEAIRTTLP